MRRSAIFLGLSCVLLFCSCKEEDIVIEGIWEMNTIVDEIDKAIILPARFYDNRGSNYIHNSPIVFHENTVEFPDKSHYSNINWRSNFNTCFYRGNQIKIQLNSGKEEIFDAQQIYSDYIILSQQDSPIFYLTKYPKAKRNQAIKRIIFKERGEFFQFKIFLNAEGEYYFDYLQDPYSDPPSINHKWLEGSINEDHKDYIWTLLNRIDYQETQGYCGIFWSCASNFSIQIFFETGEEINIEFEGRSSYRMDSQLQALVSNMNRLIYNILEQRQDELKRSPPAPPFD